LSKTTINAVEIFAPETAEQKRIGEFFAKIDNLITLHQRALM
jgi:type I restriction enzyme S subunit